MKQQFPSTRSSPTAPPTHARPPDSSSIGVHHGVKGRRRYILAARTNPPKSRIVSRLASSVSAFSIPPRPNGDPLTLADRPTPPRESRIEHRNGGRFLPRDWPLPPSLLVRRAPVFSPNSRKVAETSVFHSPPVKYYSSFFLFPSPAYIRP